jgi:hypothetical protein
MKSKVACESVKSMNSHMNTYAFVDEVGSKNEHIYDENFFEQLDGVMTMISNITTRKFVVIDEIMLIIFHSRKIH